MRKNEYNSLEEFKAQYTGVWDPSDGHWFGLDFIYKGKEYRFNTGSMYSESNTILEDGREASFGLYKKNNASQSGNEYTLLAEFATIEEALTVIYILHTESITQLHRLSLLYPFSRRLARSYALQPCHSSYEYKYLM